MFNGQGDSYLIVITKHPPNRNLHFTNPVKFKVSTHAQNYQIVYKRNIFFSVLINFSMYCCMFIICISNMLMDCNNFFNKTQFLYSYNLMYNIHTLNINLN